MKIQNCYDSLTVEPSTCSDPAASVASAILSYESKKKTTTLVFFILAAKDSLFIFKNNLFDCTLPFFP